MITLTQINQYAKDNNLGDDTDVFYILSQMQLYYPHTPQRNKESTTDSKVEYTTQDVLDLFST